MAYVAQSNVATGDVLTAATWNQAVVENARFGAATFTNEAARDAAITSPQEGMTAYLTAPTVPAATGGVTGVPTGITTVYNGSVWVCTTPVSARTTNLGTVATGSYTATLSGSPGTNPSVTLTTGTSALVQISSNINTSASVSIMSVAVSGATTVAATDDYCLATVQVGESVQTYHFILANLTGGTNTFTLQYRSGGTGSYQRRSLTVVGVA